MTSAYIRSSNRVAAPAYAQGAKGRVFMKPISVRLREARTGRGWSQPRLVRELRQTAARRGHQLPSDASVKRRIASWENTARLTTSMVRFCVTPSP
ncbi:hypothetical protein GCM10020295_25920 [Streptomyces cinereospinus]